MPTVLNRKDFSRFAGRWSLEEANAFNEATARSIDEDLEIADKAIRQREAVLAVAGGWRDDRAQDEVIADIEAHRTCSSDSDLIDLKTAKERRRRHSIREGP